MAAFGTDESANAGVGAELLLAGSECHTKCEFHVRCRDLRKMDYFSDSDPFCVVYLNGVEIGRTEIIRDNHNPEFTKSFLVDYFFEEVQTVQVRVFDEDKKGSTKLADHDFMGLASFLLGDLMCSQGQTLSRPLSASMRVGAAAAARSQSQSSKNLGSGFIIVHAEEVQACHDHLTLQLKGCKLKNKAGMFGTSDPYYVLSRVREDGEWTPVLRSPVVMNNLNPQWPVVQVGLQQLCNADMERPLKIDIYDWINNSKHTHMGECTTSARAIMGKPTLPVTAIGRGHAHRKPGGTLEFVQVSLTKRYSFLDYIRGGWEMNMVIAIDYTGSNGNPAQFGTLHYIDQHAGTPNPYQQVITSLTEVMKQYDHDQLFPVYGFGARGGQQRRVSHCFPLTGDPSNPYVHGVEGVLQAYRHALTQWALSGPTIFAQVITAAASQCRRHVQMGKMAYTLLLIITDGVINDMQATKDAIVDACDLPLSIIIVGVGEADFSAMEELDGDDVRITNARGLKATRDIVQFVKFNDFKNAAPGRLAKETLLELPTQMMSYFSSKRIKPPAPTHALDDAELVGPSAPPPGAAGAASALGTVAEEERSGGRGGSRSFDAGVIQLGGGGGGGGPVVVTAEEVQMANLGKTLLSQHL